MAPVPPDGVAPSLVEPAGDAAGGADTVVVGDAARAPAVLAAEPTGEVTAAIDPAGGETAAVRAASPAAVAFVLAAFEVPAATVEAG